METSSEEFGEIMNKVMVYLKEHLDTLHQQPVKYNTYCTASTTNTHQLNNDFPLAGQDIDQTLSDLFKIYALDGLNASSGGYTAFVGGGGLPLASIADLISGVLNRYTGFAHTAPGFVKLEVQVIKWLCKLVGYNCDTSGGILTSGGSMAHWSGICTAINNIEYETIDKVVVYMSDQTHYCIPKALKLCGIRTENIRIIESDYSFRICIQSLIDQIQCDKNNGLKPLVIISNAGTVNTGAIDDMESICEIAQKEGMWHHVDACYGGCFLLTDYGKQLMKGIEQVDSVVIDPHKGLMGLPFGTGCLLVKNIHCLKKAFNASETVEYLFKNVSESKADIDPSSIEYYNLADMTPELTRPFRGLRLWLPLMIHGTQVFIDNIEEKLKLARYITEKLREIDGVEIVTEPNLTVLNFRLIKRSSNEIVSDEAEIEQLSRSLLTYASSTCRNLLYPTRIKGKYVIRICILAFRTHLQNVQWYIEDIHSGIEKVWNSNCGTEFDLEERNRLRDEIQQLQLELDLKKKRLTQIE
jgi:aromatic-L-amino-acid decarboxylase